jgi:hypothetical protein
VTGAVASKYRLPETNTTHHSFLFMLYGSRKEVLVLGSCQELDPDRPSRGRRRDISFLPTRRVTTRNVRTKPVFRDVIEEKEDHPSCRRGVFALTRRINFRDVNDGGVWEGCRGQLQELISRRDCRVVLLLAAHAYHWFRLVRIA